MQKIPLRYSKLKNHIESDMYNIIEKKPKDDEKIKQFDKKYIEKFKI